MSSKSFFPGFSSGTEVIPTQFFSELLPMIQDLAELKVTLYAFYILNQFDGRNRYIMREDFFEDKSFMEGLSPSEAEAEFLLDQALNDTVSRGTFLRTYYMGDGLYFLNSPRGRAALAQLEDGTWVPSAFTHLSAVSNVGRPPIYKLYEDNIGALTPMITDRLRDAEKDYSYEWIADAIEESVMNNARSWRYVETILRSWKENGRNGFNN